MKLFIAGAALAVLLLLFPGVAAALLGAVAVTAASKPALLAFALGVAARPHLTRRQA